MEKMIFVNLPVADLERSKAFYEAVGAVNNPQFTDESAAMMSFSQAINVMLLTHDRFRDFSPLPVADARKVAQVLLAVSVESREAVDATIERAIAAGGAGDPSPVDDYEFMYGRSFADPDGHMWGVNWMDADAALAGRSSNTEAV